MKNQSIAPTEAQMEAMSIDELLHYSRCGEPLAIGEKCSKLMPCQKCKTSFNLRKD